MKRQIYFLLFYNYPLLLSLVFFRDNQIPRDGFDKILDNKPETGQYVKKSLLQFANYHLGNFQKINCRPLNLMLITTFNLQGKVNLSATNLETDFGDGVKFIVLIGIIEGLNKV